MVKGGGKNCVRIKIKIKYNSELGVFPVVKLGKMKTHKSVRVEKRTAQ